MAKDKISDYDASAAGNSDIGGIGILGTNAVSNFDGALRELMSQLADMNSGTAPIFDTMRWCDPADNTKLFRFDGVGVDTGTIRVLSVPNASGTVALLGLSQTWSGTQTFPTLTVSSATPTITLTDTDTGADNFLSANNTAGSVVISADTNNEVANSTVLVQIDGGTTASFAANGTMSIFGALALSSSAPTLTFTDTDTGADSSISANNSTGSLVISADTNNEVATSQILFQVDGGTQASISATGTLTAFGNMAITGTSPTITLTDTDTGADNTISASNSTGSIVISADANNEVASSTILLQIDGSTRATFAADGSLSMNGAAPIISLTDTDTSATSLISASTSTGSLIFSADSGNGTANSIIGFNVDGTQRATLNGSGEFSLTSNFFQNFTSLPSFGSSTTAGVALDPNGTVYVSRSGGSSLSIQRTTSDGAAVVFTRQTTGVGSITLAAASTTYNTSSDGRLKTNRKALLNSGAVIDALQPVTYDWTHVEGETGVGFIAQDLHQIIPEAVSPGDTDLSRQYGDEGFEMWGIDMSKIVPYLVAELKDVRARLAALEAK